LSITNKGQEARSNQSGARGKKIEGDKTPTRKIDMPRRGKERMCPGDSFHLCPDFYTTSSPGRSLYVQPGKELPNKKGLIVACSMINQPTNHTISYNIEHTISYNIEMHITFFLKNSYCNKTEKKRKDVVDFHCSILDH
jgi:hypothetical protein